jgi:hypothetical protein
MMDLPYERWRPEWIGDQEGIGSPQKEVEAVAAHAQGVGQPRIDR